MKALHARRQLLVWTLAALLPFAVHAREPDLARVSPQVEPRIEPLIEPHPGAQLPLQEVFIDDDGRALRLARLFGDKPVLLVPGYYHCPNVCSTLMQGVLEALAASGLAPDSYRLVALSIDPGEDAQTAAHKKAAFHDLLGKGVEAHFLTGQAPAIQRLSMAAGWHYRFDAVQQQFVHPAGFMLVGPDGRIARYVAGLRFDARELRQALQGANSPQADSFAQTFWLLCGHAGWTSGRNNTAAMNAVRLACAGTLLLCLGGVWRLRRQRRKRA